jgi:hypothetical protein
MTEDDICGYEDTTTGHPCQHSAGSCPIPSHSNDDLKNPQGRNHALTPDRHQIVVETIRNIEPLTSAAERASVDRETIDNWYKEGQRQARLPPDERDERHAFFEDCADARADAKAELLSKMEQADSDWRMVAWKLEHLYESEFYLPIKKKVQQQLDASHEHTGEDGGPLELELTETVVETDYNE